MIWAIHGPVRAQPGARIVGWGWLTLTVVGVPWLLSFAQPTIWQISRPWYLAWAGLIYIVAAVATLTWIATTHAPRRGDRAERHPGETANGARPAGVSADAGEGRND
jgi:alpha-1,2-mannosyltransferase